MTIVCGTDFSSGSSHAVAAATALATRLETDSLWFVHVLDPALQTLDAVAHAQVQASAEQRLGTLVRDIQDRTGRHADARVLCGPVSETLVTWAEEQRATALILSSQGHGGSPFYRLGGVSERVALTARVPVLVVRDAAPFTAWARGERPLRLVLGVDWTTSSEPPLRWVKRLREAGPCDVCVAHIYYPPEARRRYGLPHQRSIMDPDPEAERLLARDLARRVGDMRGAGTVTFQPALGVGRLGDHLLALAEGERADVTVIGTHQRRGLARLGSVSGVVLHYSHASVACVPEARDESLLPVDIPPMRRVLIPTDLSALANAAIPYGYALLPDGDGEVWLLHVLPAESRTTAPPEHAEIVARLRALVPAAALEKHIVTRIDVVQSADVARTIRETAERLGADVICMASHGRAGLARTLLGSVAEAVMRQSRRPTLIIRAGLSE